MISRICAPNKALAPKYIYMQSNQMSDEADLHCAGLLGFKSLVKWTPRSLSSVNVNLSHEAKTT